MSERVNLFADHGESLPQELVTTLVDAANVRIERIVSHGHASPEGFWSDQDESEWVVVLRGAARVQMQGDPHPLQLQRGDSINIPAHRRHRVEWTTPDEPTIWLAVFYQSEA